MNLTPQEKSLMQKVPEQWRGLLTLLLGNKVAKRERLLTLVSMRYRRQMTHSAESWDALLTAMSRRVPVVGSDGCLSFQSLLWSFPVPFIQDFLRFLLRFHDTISGDSLDRFLKTPTPPDSCLSFSAPLFQELSAILEKRSGVTLTAETESPPEKKTSVEGFAASGVERNCMGMSRSGGVCVVVVDDGDVGVGGESDAGKSRRVVELSGISGVKSADREMLKVVRSEDLSVLNAEMFGAKTEMFGAKTEMFGANTETFGANTKMFGAKTEMFGANKPATLPPSSESLIPHPDPILNSDPKHNMEEIRSAEVEEPRTADTVKNVDGFILVLDSSDEEDALEEEKVEEKENMEVDDDKRDETTDEMQKDAEIETAAECEKVEQYTHEEMSGSLNHEIVKSQGDYGATTMSKDDQMGESVMKAEEVTSGQKLKEALSSGGRDAVSSDFHFVSSLPASQVGPCFASVEWSGIEEEAVCGLIQSMVGLAEKLSHAVSAALVQSIVRPIYQGVDETPSRQLMSSLSDLAATCPDQLASVLCDCLQESPCSGVQSEMVTSLCKTWTAATLLFFLRKLCRSDILLDDNLLAVVQCVLGKQPDLSSDLLESVVRLLESGSAPLARNAKYGRLVLNFVKTYKTQINASHLPSLQSIVSVHSSVIRKSLQSAVNSLPS